MIHQLIGLKTRTDYEMYFISPETSAPSHLSGSICSSLFNDTLTERHGLRCKADFLMPSSGQFDSDSQSHEMEKCMWERSFSSKAEI